MREEKQTFLELIIGIVLFSVLLGIIGVMLSEDRMAFFLGVSFGGAVACGLCFHMYRTLEVTLDMDPESAVKRARTMTGVRMLFMALAVFVGIKFSEILSIIGVVLGILTLKFSAFAQPLVHIIITKFFDKGR